MSGQYTNHTKALATFPSTKVWNHVSNSQNEGTDDHGSTYNEDSLHSPVTITCSPHLLSQISQTKNPSWYSSSTLLPHTVDSLSKSKTPLLSLQMLVDNKQNKKKSKSEKKDNVKLDLNTDSLSIYPKVCQENQTHFSSRNIDKIHDNDNISASDLSNNSCHLLDSDLSVTSVNTLPINTINESRYYQEKNKLSKITSTIIDNNKSEIISNNDNKPIDNNINYSQNLLIFPPDVTIEKIDTEKKEAIIGKTDSSNIAQTTKLTPTSVTLMSNSDKNIKDNIQDINSRTKRYVTEFNLKSAKNVFKKGRKGVDSILEKLENCSKRFYNSDNFGPTLTSTADERDTNSIRSMSPEYCKSRSPNNRDDDVVSPSFSNDDSNDTKQRRKRKLGKPIRLSKELKLEHDTELQHTNPNLQTKSESSNCTNETLLPQNSSLISITEINENNTQDLTINKKSKTKIYSTENNEKNEETKISNFDLGEIFQKRNEDKNYQDNLRNESTIENKQFKIDMSQYLIQALKETKCVRKRISSECSVNINNINKIKRRKSCDDIRNLLYVSNPVSTAPTNTIAFNEVESQLEKMFAGIIETDKDLLKKTLLETEKSVSLLSDEEQKENLNSQKIVSKKILKKLCSNGIRKKNHKTNKRKNTSKIRSHKKKSNSNMEIDDVPEGSLRKDKKKKCTDKRLIKKSSKISTFKDIVSDSSMNANSNKYRGPVIQVKGSKSNSLYVQIINVPREDDEEKRKTIGNGIASRSKRLHFQNNLDYRGKVCNTGLFNSTLSTRYDAHTPDVTWICVFCKRGPHFIIPGDSTRPHPNIAGPHIIPGAYTAPAGVLSDLFGPYIIGKNVEDNVMSPDEYEIMKEQKQGNKNKRSLRHAGLAEQFLAKVSKKKKKLLNNSNAHMGMVSLDCEEQRWEVWLHEECIVWAAGVYITGGRISGLQDAVWDASQSVCVSCGLVGANIGCIKRGCKSVVHYCCALTSGWQLDINQFIPKCNIHRKS